jgi:3,4-dihydroxy 2-butanone 4-phosphate synthase/GTP cyclohydrolase II
MKDDGTMARRDDLIEFAKKHNLHIVYISDIVEYRLQYESLVKKISEEVINFFGVDFKKITFIDHQGNEHYVFLSNIDKIANVKFYQIESNVEFLNRIDDFAKVVKFIEKEGGAIIFMKNDKNYDRQKEFGIGAQILKKLGVEKLHLISNSGKNEFYGLKGFGIEILDTIKV